MAKSTSRPPKRPTPIDTSTPFDVPLTDMSAAEAPPPEQVEEPPAKLSDLGVLGEGAKQWQEQYRPGPTRKIPTFVQTMNSVPKGDWGPRANIYLYRVEPVICRGRPWGSVLVDA